MSDASIENQITQEDMVDFVVKQAIDQFSSSIDTVAQAVATEYVIHRSRFNGLRAIDEVINEDEHRLTKESLERIIGTVARKAFIAGRESVQEAVE